MCLSVRKVSSPVGVSFRLARMGLWVGYGANTENLIPNTFLATRSSATAPRRLRLPGAGLKLGDIKSEIRNPKSESHRAAEESYTRVHENW